MHDPIRTVVRGASTVALLLFCHLLIADAAPVAAQDAPDAQCRAVLSPSTLTAPVTRERDEAAARRIAGRVTLQARIDEGIGSVREVRVEPESRIEIDLAEVEAGAPSDDPDVEVGVRRGVAPTPLGAADREAVHDRVPLAVDVSEAVAGEWKVTLVGEDGAECGATLRIRTPGRIR